MLKKLMEILKEKELDYNSFFFLYQLVNNINIHKVYNYVNTADLIELDFIIENNDHTLSATEWGINFIKETVKEIKKAIQLENKKDNSKLKESIKEWLPEYRELFKGSKAGAMGDPKACVDKMVRFFDEYPEYADKDIILQATKKYVNSEAITNYKYLQRADYIIYKQMGKEESSRLASLCSDIQENQELDHSFIKML